MSELKKCPFCGGEAFYIKIMGNYEKPHEIYCSTCDGGITEGRSKDGVIHNWNTRPIEDALTARIAELEKALNIDTDLTIAGLRKELRDATARIAELEALVNELIKAGQALTRVAEWRYTNLPELLAWDTLVENIYKEREE